MLEILTGHVPLPRLLHLGEKSRDSLLKCAGFAYISLICEGP